MHSAIRSVMRRVAPKPPLSFARNLFTATSAVLLNRKKASDPPRNDSSDLPQGLNPTPASAACTSNLPPHMSGAFSSQETAGVPANESVHDAPAIELIAEQNDPQSRSDGVAAAVNALTQEKVNEELLKYMSMKDIAKKTVTLSETEAEEATHESAGSESATAEAEAEGAENENVKLLKKEKEEVAVIKQSFLKAFPDFKFASAKHFEQFKTYGMVHDYWRPAIPPEVKVSTKPVTVETLTNVKSSVNEICENFLRSITKNYSFIINNDNNLSVEKATLFLLRSSLVIVKHPTTIATALYEHILNKSAKPPKGGETNGPIRLDGKDSKFVLPLDVRDGGEEAEIVKQFFNYTKKNRQVDHVLLIGGESGSGKTHLGLYAAKVGLPEDQRHTLTLFSKITRTPEVENMEKRARLKSAAGASDADKERREKVVAEFLWDLIFKICSDAKAGFKNPKKTLMEASKHTSLFNGARFFTNTILVLDEAIHSPVLMQALLSSVTGGFMNAMKDSNMEFFFGYVYVVCCSTGSRDSILASGSSPEKYVSVQMRQSDMLFKLLINNSAYCKTLLTNPHMDIVLNRRCAVLAAEGFRRLTVGVNDSKPVISTAGEPNVEDDASDESVVWYKPSSAIANSVGGFVAMYAARQYASENGLADMSREQRLELVAKVIQELLRTPSMKPGELPFANFYEDPAKKGIVDIHEGYMYDAASKGPAESTQSGAEGSKCARDEHVGSPMDVVVQMEGIDKKPEKPQKLTKTYTFSHVQMLLACSYYGTAAVSMNTPDSFEILSTVMFGLYLRAFLGSKAGNVDFKEWRLRAAVKGNTGGCQATIKQLFPPRYSADKKEVIQLEALSNVMSINPLGVVGEVAFPGTSAACFPFTVGLKHTNILFTILKGSQTKCYISSLMSPSNSSYADSLIVCGKVLFLIQSKKRTFGNGKKEVRNEIWKMGLVPVSAPEAEKKEKIKYYDKNFHFTLALCEELGIERVVPVFCAEKEGANSCVNETEVRMPTESEIESASVVKKKREITCTNALMFVPRMELKATFTRPNNDNDDEPWTYLNQDT